MKIVLLLHLILLNAEEAFLGKPLLPRFSPEKNENRAIPMPPITTRQVQQAFDEAYKQAESKRKLENSLAENGETYSKTDLTVEARFLGAPHSRSMDMHHVQTFLEDVTRNLNKRFKMNKSQMTVGLRRIRHPSNDSMLQQCRTLRSSEKCDPNYKYRLGDGGCNNLRHPDWGRSFVCYDRLLTPAYADGLSSPRAAVSGHPLPNSRIVSFKLNKDFAPAPVFYTHMSMQWGQFLDHDIAHAVSPRAGDNSDIYKCCPLDAERQFPQACYAISLPKDDEFFGKLKKDCMNFVRSVTCSADCRIGSPRRQMTQQTSFIDGSSAYGEDEEQMKQLRAMTGGQMKVQKTGVGDLLPSNFKPVLDQCTPLMGNVTCFQAGDSRVNSQPGLTSLHTLWVRNHNRIASILAKSYPDKSDEELFQEARRISGAQYQLITYREFLPDVLGPDLMTFFKLKVLRTGYTTYNPRLNPTLFTEFATGAYRFGHTLIQDSFSQVNEKGELGDPVHLRYNMYHPISMYQGKLGPVLKGMTVQKGDGFDRHFVLTMKNHLFEVLGQPSGFDLSAINIQRGRDHGMPGYAAIIEFCFGKPIQKFSDLDTYMLPAKRKQLETVYSSVRDVDFYFGGLSETPMEGAMVGPTFGCIIGLQFNKLKYGDRFYFEHAKQSGSFTPGQMAQIRKTSLARIICDNVDGIGTISRNVFRPPDAKNILTKCNALPAEDLTKWLDI